jgi:hypothetical protein
VTREVVGVFVRFRASPHLDFLWMVIPVKTLPLFPDFLLTLIL